MNEAKLQAILDMFAFYGADVMCNTAEWCDLTCAEQMIVEANL